MPKPLPILAQGPTWLIAGKPPKLLVHRTELSTDRVAMLQWIRDQIGRRVDAIHRLDRPASGCVLFGTQQGASRVLHDALAEPSTQKIYLAIVRGCIPVGSHTVIERELDGKASTTEVTVLGSSEVPRCSLVRCEIRSGRFHQIRRHLARRGHPVLGDSHHGDTRFNREWRETVGLPRLLLHGWQLHVTLPGEDGPQRVEARCPIWPDMAVVLRSLPFYDQLIQDHPLIAEGWDVLPPRAGVPRPATPPEGDSAADAE
ncbi:MAG: pseudouridine synthase [Myxococcota bacterium]